MKLHPDARSVPSPIVDLARAILDASEYCSFRVQPFLNFPEASLNRSRFICVTFEFSYFFMHMMNRHALEKLGHARMASLQSRISPLLVSSVLESFYGDRSESDKVEIRAVFYDNLNRAELGYSNCKELISSQDPFSKEALLSRLAWHVANLCPDPCNKPLILGVIDSAFEKWREISFDELLSRCREFTVEENRN